ncbi:MAG TPA: hypothetical protein ENI76_00910 [Ignavibacteria bacterium]|nr:hypothetical protein [Ignavibacteria bacterium]
MLNIYVYTKGTGSGHLTRVNAIYKGFLRSDAKFKLYVSAHRSKYLDFLEPGIILCNKGEFPRKIDIFICDWRSDSFVDGLPKKLAETWIGLRRLGKMKVTFPKYYHVIAIEPDVKGDICIWPIINTWPDELVTRKKLREILKVESDNEIGLLCENGAYLKHLNRVFRKRLPKKVLRFKISNSPFSKENKDLSYYPVAKLFKSADYIVIGAGYNSFHEALSYADMNKTTIVNVGGDDQAVRIKQAHEWTKGRGSQAHILAKHVINYHNKH